MPGRERDEMGEAFHGDGVTVAHRGAMLARGSACAFIPRLKGPFLSTRRFPRGRFVRCSGNGARTGRQPPIGVSVCASPQGRYSVYAGNSGNRAPGPVTTVA